jgi:spore coat protein U-like protein
MRIRTSASFCLLASLLAVLPLLDPSAEAATATGTFTSTITLQASCQVVSMNTLTFGTQNVLTANVDVQADFSVQCTNTTPYKAARSQPA